MGSAAQVLSEEGAKIVAVSTADGAIFDPSGLDVPRLIELKGRFGDHLVEKYDAQKIEKSDLLCLPLDVLIPCARRWSINMSNVEQIKSKIICPGANVPMTIEAERFLHKKKTLCLPDFVANSGAAFGSHIGFLASERKIREVIAGEFSREVLKIIRLAEQRNLTSREIACEMAVDRFSKTKRRAEQDVLGKRLKSALKRLPRPVRKTLAPLYFRRRLKLFH